MEFTIGSLMRAVVVALIVFLLYIDCGCLPTSEYVAGEVCRLFQENIECSSCQKLLNHLDTDAKGEIPSILRSLSLLGKPHIPAVQHCDGIPHDVRCDSASEDCLIERWSLASAFVHEIGKFYSISDPHVFDIINTRNDELVEYILDENEARENERQELYKQDECLSGDGVNHEDFELPQSESESWLNESDTCSVRFTSDRQRSFCWQHCVGTLSFRERVRFRLLNAYLSYNLRAQIISLQRQRNTFFCLLLELVLVGAVLGHYTAGRRGSHPLNGIRGGNQSCAVLALPVTGRATARRPAPSRPKGTAYRRD